MRRFTRSVRWVLAGAMLLGLGGCFTQQQLLDFGRTEFARVVADVLGQVFQLYTLGTA